LSFKIIKPNSLPDALSSLSEYADNGKAMAGGTAVVLMLQQRLIAPEALIFLDGIPNFSYIKEKDKHIHIGPSTTLREIELSSLIQEKLPALAKACGEVGNVRIRNQATIGGNIAEADYASDPPTVLIALNAKVKVNTEEETRFVPIEEFYLGFYTTILESNELITELVIPMGNHNTKMNYLKFKTRSSEDRPCVGISSVADIEEGVCTNLRVVVGAACENPIHLPQFEMLAEGKLLSAEIIEKISNGYADTIDTIDDLRGTAWYRTQMIRTHIKRSLEEISNGNR
jgi:aerobic carbon-monoxide dehydrogenase medium subunit